MYELDVAIPHAINSLSETSVIADFLKAPRLQTIEEAGDEFASRATPSILTPDENVEGLDALAKALRLSGRH